MNKKISRHQWKSNFLPALVMVGPVTLLMILLVAVPLVYVVVMSFCSIDDYYNVTFEFSTKNYARLFNVDYIKIYVQSIMIALLTTLICILVGYPFSYLIARTKSRKKRLLYMLVIIPFWTNSLIRIYGWRTFLGTNGWLNQMLQLLHLSAEPMGVWKLAPALAAGNSIVYKPASNCVLSSIKLFEIFEKVGMPKGSVNLVLGPGGSIGNELAENRDVDMITFTGSTEVGQSIMRAAAGNVKKIGLELGGKSPNVIFADADLEGAVEWAMIGIFLNQGEICSAGSRIIIEESMKDAFVKRLAERANAITIGNPLENPDMGPLVSESHMNKVLDYIKKGVDEGATLVCGGERYTEGACAKGYFVRPTIFDNCTDDMTIVKEEIFGPVVTVQTFRTEQEAINMANNTPYGLAGAVFTADGARALRVIKEIRAGITWINCYNPCFNEAPWGGYKMSGIGRELGVHGLEEYQEIKQININLNPGIVGWYEH